MGNQASKKDKGTKVPEYYNYQPDNKEVRHNSIIL